MMTNNDRGFSLIELLIVLAVVGVLSGIAVPQLLRAYERSRQRVSMADMRSIAAANATYHVDSGAFPATFADLMPEYLNPVPPADAWNNAWAYERASDDDYVLTSYGQGGASGPAAPDPWTGDPFEADLILTNGAFTQAPTAQQ
jgi:general secretion pathway protein G